jgi:hypothetical protein
VAEFETSAIKSGTSCWRKKKKRDERERVEVKRLGGVGTFSLVLFANLSILLKEF